MIFLLHTIGDLATVHDLVYPALTNWYNIGLQLKLPAYELDAIERSRGEDGDHLRDTLKKWLKRNSPTPTIKALVDALKSSPVGESRLASEVEDKLHSLLNSCSFDKSTHTPLVPSRQYSLPLLIAVMCLLIFITLMFVSLVPTFTSNNDQQVTYHKNLNRSLCLPFHEHKVFVGREESKEEIIKKIHEPHPPIITIVGPPGFGKSTLAKHIGHAMLKDGFFVNYVDMTEVSSKQALAVKVLDCDSTTESIKNITIERLYKWARGLNQRTLLILDNCDVILHNTTDLQTAIEKLLDNSPRLKILITSRKTVWQLYQFTYLLGNLSSEASCTLLQKVTHHEGLNSTTCKLIASLTHNVPLVLQVVGAILNDVNSPDVMTIVRKLEQDPISTLSPKDAPEQHRVNASITLSYQYLAPQLQKTGRYVANFPGSFDEKAVCDILISITNNSIPCSDIVGHLEELVKRSLLECKRQKNRYQFHALIREFFLAVSKEATGENETNHFLSYFQLFYITVVETLTEDMDDDYEQALTKFDIERHNILHVMEYLGRPSRMTSVTFYCVMTLPFYLQIGIFRSRFTSRELLGIVSRSVECLRLVVEQPIPLSDFSIFQSYVNMIVHLADLQEELNGASDAIQTFTTEEHVIVNMEQKYSAEVSSSVILFYRRLSFYYWLSGEHEKAKECNERILRQTRGLLSECEPGKCQYEDIGMSYFNIEDYTNSAHFLQSALDLEGENLTAMARIRLIAHLHISYYQIPDIVKAENVLENLTALLPVVMAQSEAEAYRAVNVLITLIAIYQINNKFDEVRRLQDKWMNTVRHVGAKTTKETILIATKNTGYSFRAKDYQQAADLGKFALQSFTHLNNDQLKRELVQVQVTVGMAVFMNWNFSEGLDYMELAADYICENDKWANSSFIDLQFTVCLALRGHLCPLRNMLKTNILPYGVQMIRMLLDILVDISTIEFSDKGENEYFSTQNVLLLPRLGICIIKFNVNVMYVMAKLLLLSYLAYFLWCCVTRIVHYCKACIIFVSYIVFLYTVYMCPSCEHVHVALLPSPSYSWLLLTVCVSLLFIVCTVWLLVNTLPYVMVMIVLILSIFY